MIADLKVLAIIPARGGSKRIPDKNITLLAGKPLIAYSILEAKKSKYIDRIITSTDNLEIARVAKEYGSEVPFMRPPELALDGVKDLPAFEHALRWLEENEKYTPDIIVQLRPTSPLRTATHIDDAISLLAANPDADSVRTVAEPEQSPYKMYAIDANGYLKPLIKIEVESEAFNLPAQLLPKTYKHVGYVDAMWRRTIVEKKKMTGVHVLPLVLEKAYSGINTSEDLKLYEYLMQK